MLALLFWVVLTSAELLKLEFTSITTSNNPVIERRDLERPVINDLMHQVSHLQLMLAIIFRVF